MKRRSQRMMTLGLMAISVVLCLLWKHLRSDEMPSTSNPRTVAVNPEYITGTGGTGVVSAKEEMPDEASLEMAPLDWQDFDVPAVEEDPPDAPALSGREARDQLKEAGALVWERKYDEAIELLRAIAAGADDVLYEAKARWKLADLYAGKKDYVATMAQLYAVLDLHALSDSQEFDVHLDLFRTSLKAFEKDRAQAVLRRIEELYLGPDSPMYSDPDHFPEPDKVYCELVTALWNNGFVDQTIQYASAVAGSGNKYQRKASILMARALDAMGRRSEAVTILHDALAVAESGDASYLEKVYFELIDMSARSDDAGSAMRYATRGAGTFAGTDEYGNFIYRVGQILKGHAVEAWRGYLEHVGYSDQVNARMSALEQLVAVAKREQNWPEAERYYRQLLTLPERPARLYVEDYLHLMGAMREQEKDIDGVVDSLLAYLDEATPADTKGLYRIASELEDAKRYTEAEQFYRQALQVGADDRWTENARVRLAELLNSQGRAGEAVPEFLTYIQMNEAAGDYDQAIHGLVKMLSSPEVISSGVDVQELRQMVQNDIGQITRVKDITDLVVFLQNREETQLAKYCLEQAIARVDTLRNEEQLSPAQWVSFEQLLIRRMSELGMTDRLFERAGNLPEDLLAHAGVSLETSADLQYYVANALWQHGNAEEGRELFSDVLSSVEADKSLFPAYAVCIGMNYLYSDRDEALELFESAVDVNATDDYSCLAQLHLAAGELLAGDLDAAGARITSVIGCSDPEAGIQWKRRIYWNSRYLQGLLMTRRGEVEGEAVLQQAREHSDLWPSLAFMLD